jgi:shikimate kinase
MKRRKPERGNAILIRIMGTGQIAIGRVLAAGLGRDFVDADDLIERIFFLEGLL